MICSKCNKEIDNLKGGFVTLLNGNKYHTEWVEKITEEEGTETEIIHESCYP